MAKKRFIFIDIDFVLFLCRKQGTFRLENQESKKDNCIEAEVEKLTLFQEM